ncbi:hypothetical protein GTA08_BOTSDO03092 [Neofusicoccum parvum]|uniref:Uncharacterized protein n=1 Tax=Neofusicoccum parvum TaxID=310453 RepID=A0ACB5RTK7_9PEZI|nr:hypothetical protein GTA08_BOTSDO03092 [Neofusicoccum parvum]
MAGFIQNYVGGIVQNAAVGAATYAITTGGRVVGDAVISAGDLIEGAGRGVGNSVEGYIDRYGNWIRSYGDGAIAATAADAPAYARTRTAVKPPKQKAPPGGAQKALPAPNKPGTKALPAPEPKKAAAAARPGLKKSLSDSASATAAAGAKGLPPVSGVKKVGGGAQLSKGQLAKARGIKAADLKGAGGKAVGAVGGGVGAVGGGVGALGGGVARAVPGVGGKRSPAQSGGKKPASSGGSEAGSAAGSTASTAAAAKKTGAADAAKRTVAAVNGGVPSARTPLPPAGGAEKKSAQYPKPFSAKRPDGKVVVSKESRPGAVKSAAPKGGVGAGAGKQEGKKEYDFLTADKKQGGGKGKDGKGGFDFMTLMAEDPKKKGPGSVAGSVKTNGTAKKAGAVGGGGKQETSGKYEFF